MKKRILSLALTFVMMLSILPLGTFILTASAKITTDGLVYETYEGEVTITDYTGSATEVVIPAEIEGYPVTSIGSYAFSYCSSLTSITIGDGVTSIGYEAFLNCDRLKDVYITDLAAWCNIDFYDSYSNPLYYADNLYINGVLATDIVIPSGVTSIGDYAFSGCSSLTSVKIPSGITNIGSFAFYDCSSLTSVTIGNSVTSIGDYAFLMCSSLTSVTIPNGVTSIGDYAFYNCSSLTSVTIGDSVESIGEDAFSGCSSLTSITIPEGVISISYRAFFGCSSLTSITIPDSVESIGDSAFYDCSNLKTVFYGGSETDRENLNIVFDGNDVLFFDAIWHYEATDHSWDSGAITTPPSCTDGVRTYSCTIEGCDGKKTEPVAATDKHSFDDGNVTISPTITSLGTKTYTCKNCNHKYTEKIPMLVLVVTGLKLESGVKQMTVSWNKNEYAGGYEILYSTSKDFSADNHTVIAYLNTVKKTIKKLVGGKEYYVKVRAFKKVSGKTYYGAYSSAKKVTTYQTITSAKVTVKDQTYSGKAKKPSVTVKLNGKTLKKNVDYTVTYKNNKKIGKATVTITGKGAYMNSVSKTFKINPKKVSGLKVKAGKKQMTVSFKKDKSAGGYEIVYATSKNFKKGKKTIKIKSYKTAKKVIKKLKSKKTYYVKVRSFKKVGKTTYYGAYTTVKKIKVK